MTPRPTRHDIKRDLDELTDESTADASGLAIVHEDPETGEWFRDAGHEEPVDPTVAEQADPLMILSETVVETDWSRDR